MKLWNLVLLHGQPLVYFFAKKPDGSFRMGTDYLKLTLVTKSGSYPLPRIEDIFDNVGSAKYVSKADLFKG